MQSRLFIFVCDFSIAASLLLRRLTFANALSQHWLKQWDSFPTSALDPAATTRLMSKKNQVTIYELLFKEWWLPSKMFHILKHPKLADKNVPNLHAMKASDISSLEAMWWSCLPGDISIGTLRTRASSISDITLTYLWRLCLSHCVAAALRLAALAPRSRGWAACKIPKRGGRTEREVYRRSTVPAGADRKAEAGADSAVEFQFRDSFDWGWGQWRQWSWRLCCVEKLQRKRMQWEIHECVTLFPPSSFRPTGLYVGDYHY